MKKQLIPDSDFPLVVIEIDGNLRLKGEDAQEVVGISRGEDDLVIEQREDQVYVHCTGSLDLRVPRRSEIKGENISGNASFKSVEGELDIHRVDGNLELRSLGPVRLGEVKGNLLARHVAGDLVVDTIYGNASIENIQGAFTVNGSIEGNLNLEEVDENIKAMAEGILSARLDPLPGSSHELRAGGNLACWLPEDASVEVNILDAGKISVGFDSDNIPKQMDAPFSFTLGDGEATLSLAAGGYLTVSGAPGFHKPAGFGVDVDFTPPEIPDDLGEEITRQIEAQMEMLGRQIEFQMENLSATLMGSGLSAEAAERISRKAQEASERATRRAQEKAQRAQEKIQRAQEKIERKLEAARRKAEIKSRVARKAEQRQEGKVSWKASSVPDASPPPEPVTEEERLMILRMLEEKKITLEQAEELLSALEGANE
jgi:hypothetical protein